jgi:outer membrane cobalamin receptor
MHRPLLLALILAALSASAATAQTVVTTPPNLPASVSGEASDRLPPGYFLDELVVTPAGRPTRLRDTTSNVYVVNKQDIRAVGAIDLHGALILVPGLSR